MKKSLFSFVVFAACSSGGGMVSMETFYDVPVGASCEEVVSCTGEPYAIHRLCDGALEYEYIERIKVGARNLETRHYFLLLRDGKVVSKRVETTIAPPYIFDSYEMQTTQSAPKD